MSKPSITAVTTMRNEGPFILEWIAHHQAMGVSQFLVFTNDCTDGSDHLLDQLAATAPVSHIRQSEGRGSVQWRALKSAKDREEVTDADWVVSMDCDEFICPLDGLDDLPAVLDRAGDPDALVLPWRLFGHSGHIRFADEPVCRRFTMSAPPGLAFPAAARFFKTIYKSKSGPFAKPGVHRPKTKAKARGSVRWAGPDGNAVSPDFAEDDARILFNGTGRDGQQLIQLNHYSLRSLEDFMVKRARGLPNRSSKSLDATYWAERNFNLVEDVAIQRFAAKTNARLRVLKSNPAVAAAHESCVAAHRAAIRGVLEDPDERHLISRLALLQTSVPPEPELAIELLKLIHSGEMRER